MDTPNISADFTLKGSVDKPAASLSHPREDVASDVPKVEKIDPMDAIQHLEKAVDMLNSALARDPVALRFSIDETLNRPVVSVISEKTGEVIHQLPKEEVIRAVKNLEQMRGVLFEDLG